MKNVLWITILLFLEIPAHYLFAQNSLNDVIINEFIANPATGKEWVELLVVKVGGVDMRNWRITDLSGPAASPSTTEGVLTFPNANYLSSVPQGTRILVVLKTPATNTNTFVQDTIPDDGTLVLFSVGLPGGVLDSSRTMDLAPTSSTSDNCVLVADSLKGTVIDLVSWGGTIIGWPGGLWTNNFTVNSGNGAYFTNGSSCDLNNDDGLVGWFSNQPPANLTPGEVNTTQVPPNTRRWVGDGLFPNDWSGTDNWCPQGPPEGMNIIISQASFAPVLSIPTNILSLRLLNGAVLNISTTGALTTTNDVRVGSNSRLSIGSTGPITINQQFIIDSSASVHITSNVNISNIGNDVILNGAFTIDSAIASIVHCKGDWKRGPGSSFSAGNSKFYFGDNARAISIDRGTFFDAYILPAQQVTITGNVTVNNTLTLQTSIFIDPGDTLTINNPDPTVVIDTGSVVQGTVRRAIHPTSTGHYRFHHNDIALEFYPSAVSRPSYVSVTAEPDTFLDTSGGRTFFVKRIYDIAKEGGSDFSAKLFLRYDQSEVRPGVDESQFRLWRTPDDGLNWIFVGGVVDTVNNFIAADTVREFSKWGVGIPNSPPITGVEERGVMPLAITMRQNYPNPFNPNTMIQYTITSPSFVTIKVFNILGQEVTTLIQKEQGAGNYEIEWIAKGAPSGVYFYRLEVLTTNAGQKSTYMQTQKMVLLR